MGIAKVTRNYQVTIPKDVRAIQEINVGDTILFAIEGDRVEVFKKKPKAALEEVAGIWKGTEPGWKYVKRIRKESEKRRKRLGL